MIIATIVLLMAWCLQAAPLFDFLLPVIIDEDQRITNNKMSTLPSSFPLVNKYATDVHYQIIRIPIHLQPIEARLKRAGVMLHYMKNLIKGKATEEPIKQIIIHHNVTLQQVNTATKTWLTTCQQPNSHHTVQEETFSGSTIWNCGSIFWSR